VANGASGILTAGTQGTANPEVARRTWPQWLALGLAMIAVAGVAVVWTAAGARLLLGAVGLFLAVRGAVLVRGARSGAVGPELAPRARGLGTVSVVGGVASLAVAAASAALSGWVLLAAVPVLLLAAAAALLARRGTIRRGGIMLLVWALLVSGLIAGTGLARGWDRAADLATVVAALAVAGLAVPLLIGAAGLRSVAAQPEPTRPLGCAGCACGAGGCGA
jgi:hypothetical protein